MSLRSELVDAAILLALGWLIPLAGMIKGERVGWGIFGVAIASVVFWSTIVGVGLCAFTPAHAWLAGVVA